MHAPMIEVSATEKKSFVASTLFGVGTFGTIK
jgi:hypothetical protein